MFDYTMTVTSCGRHHFLRRMLESFVKYADVMPKAIIITEDAPVEPPDWINSEPQFRDLPKIWLPNRPKLGQIASIDKAYANVHTEYIFAVEDDWVFLETGFLEESHKILEAYPMVSQCNLRGHNWLILPLMILDFHSSSHNLDFAESGAGCLGIPRCGDSLITKRILGHSRNGFRRCHRSLTYPMCCGKPTSRRRWWIEGISSPLLKSMCGIWQEAVRGAVTTVQNNGLALGGV